MNIEFGISRQCINPRVPVSLAGYFMPRTCEGVLDDLEVRAIIFKQGTDYACILHYDLVTIPQDICRKILKHLKGSGDLRLHCRNIIFSAVHTHTAPEIRQGCPGYNPNYVSFLIDRSLKAVKDALEHFQKGTLFHGQTNDCRFLFNRRYWMKNGKVQTNPGKLNPEILRPEGEIDPEIPLLAIKSEGCLRLLLFNIVNHADTIGGNHLSSDWPGVARRQLEQSMPPGGMAVPLIGASGNINHFDLSTDQNQTCRDEANRIGLGYAETIARALPKLVPVSGTRLRTVSTTVSVLPREISPKEIKEAQDILKKYDKLQPDFQKCMTSEGLAKSSPAVLKMFAERLLRQAGITARQRFRLVGISFGDSAVIASLPGEPFTEIGLTIRKGYFASKTCLTVSHSNGSGGSKNHSAYIPNVWNYGRGGYEDAPRSNPFSKNTSTILLHAWQKLAKQICKK